MLPPHWWWLPEIVHFGWSVAIVPEVEGEGKIKGVIPGGITPIRRFRIALLPAEGPPLPFRPRPPGRTDQPKVGSSVPHSYVLLGVVVTTGAGLQLVELAYIKKCTNRPWMNPMIRAKAILYCYLLRAGVHPTYRMILYFAAFVKNQLECGATRFFTYESISFQPIWSVSIASCSEYARCSPVFKFFNTTWPTFSSSGPRMAT